MGANPHSYSLPTLDVKLGTNKMLTGQILFDQTNGLNNWPPIKHCIQPFCSLVWLCVTTYPHIVIIFTHACTHTHTHTHTHAHTHTHTHIHACTHTHAHTHIHTLLHLIYCCKRFMQLDGGVCACISLYQ